MKNISRDMFFIMVYALLLFLYNIINDNNFILIDMLKKRIFSLFLIFAFLLNFFPLSALAYPAYSQPANNLAVAGPYEAAIAGVANWGTNMEDGLTDLAYEYFTAGRKYRIRQAGTISRIRIHTVDKSNITGFYLKIWRQATGAGYGYNLVGTSENLASKLVHNGFATIDLSSPITGVQEGDFYGYRIETSSRTKNFHAKPENDKSGETYLVGTFYKNGNVGSSFNWEGTPVKQFALPIELYMTAPQVVLIGDSIIAGRTAHHSYIDHLLSPLNNASSTIGWKLKNITGYTYQNMGISYSQTISVIADRFDKDVINLKPKIVVIEGGINDIAGSTTQESFIASWKSMLQKAQNDPNIETVIVLKILPWTNGSSDQMRKRDTWNAALEVEAAKYSKAIVVDAGSYVGQYRGTGDPGNLWDIKSAYRPGGGDMLHFNADGHSEIARVIAMNLPKPSATFDNDFTTWNKGEITVNYNLIQTGGNTNLNISQTDTSGIEYSTDNIYWYDATQGTGGDPMTGLSASSTPGINHSFIWNTTTDLPTTENSTVYLRIRPSDNTSSATAWAVSNSFGVDNVAPSVSDNVPVTWQNNDITVTLTCTDNGSGCNKVYYTLDGSDPTTASSYVNAGSSWQFTYSTEGTKTLKYRGEDNAGNLGGIATAANQLRLDKAAPVINDDVSAAWKTSDITVTFNCTDTASGCDKVYYTTDGTNPTTSSASVDLSDNWQFVFSTEGVYNLKYFSKDIAGNVSAIKTAVNQIKLDKTAPVVTVGTNKKESSLFTQVATISDLGSGADTSTYQWAKVSGPGIVNFGTDKALNTTISVNKAGTYVISFTASDKAGHSASANFVLTWFIPNSGNAAFFVKPITPPDGFKVKINDGATSTTNRKTTLKFNAGPDVKKIAISINPSRWF
jgi:lysophospholipase L1-like esterase